MIYQPNEQLETISFPYFSFFIYITLCFFLELLFIYEKALLFLATIVYIRQASLVRTYRHPARPSHPDTIASTAVRLYWVHVSTPSPVSSLWHGMHTTFFWRLQIKSTAWKALYRPLVLETKLVAGRRGKRTRLGWGKRSDDPGQVSGERRLVKRQSIWKNKKVHGWFLFWLRLRQWEDDCPVAYYWWWWNLPWLLYML